MRKNKKYAGHLTRHEKRKYSQIATLVFLIIGAAVIGFAGQFEAYKQPELKQIAHFNKNDIKVVQLITDRPDIETQIREIARKADFKWPDYLVKLANCESRLDPSAVNRYNNKPNGSKDRGLFQISDYWHKEVKDNCAFDINCSTKFTMEMINKGEQHQWACNDIVLARK